MRNTITSTLCGAFALLLVMVAGSPANASVLPLTVEELSAVADDIVHGTVVESESDFYSGKLLTRHEILVQDTAKGALAKNATMTLYTLGGDYGPLSAVAPGMPQLKKDEEVILFLETPDLSALKAKGVEIDEKSPMNNTPLVVGGFQGKFSVLKGIEKHEGVAGKTLEIEREVVFRAAPGRPATLAGMPTVDEFMTSLRTLNSKSLPVKTVTRDIGAKRDVQVAVPDKGNAALRAFDPFAADPAKGRAARLVRAPEETDK